MNSRKRILIYLLLALTALSASAQNSIGELFKVMPDSLMPVLSKNNRLDMIDFCEAKMKAEVDNKLGGKSEMTCLTRDSLSIRVSSVLRMDLRLVEARADYDSCRQVICMVKTYRLPSSGGEESIADYYSVRWNRLPQPDVPALRLPSSTILLQDEKLK